MLCNSCACNGCHPPQARRESMRAEGLEAEKKLLTSAEQRASTEATEASRDKFRLAVGAWAVGHGSTLWLGSDDKVLTQPPAWWPGAAPAISQACPTAVPAALLVPSAGGAGGVAQGGCLPRGGAGQGGGPPQGGGGQPTCLLCIVGTRLCLHAVLEQRASTCKGARVCHMLNCLQCATAGCPHPCGQLPFL